MDSVLVYVGAVIGAPSKVAGLRSSMDDGHMTLTPVFDALVAELGFDPTSTDYPTLDLSKIKAPLTKRARHRGMRDTERVLSNAGFPSRDE